MKEILVPFILFFMWASEIDADTFEIYTIPYEKIFPGPYGQNGQNYQKPGFQQSQRPGYQQPQRPMYPQNGRPVYQNNYPNYQQVGVNDWVCRNPSTGNMLIISSENMPVGNNQNPGLQPNIQPVQPIIPQQPVHHEVTQPSSTQNPINPFLPNVNQNPTPVPKPINCNAYPPHPLCGETIILDSTTSEAPATTKNINGEGIIDIRTRTNPASDNETDDRLIFKD